MIKKQKIFLFLTACTILCLLFINCKPKTEEMPAETKVEEPKEPLYKLSLAEWSFHNAIFGGEMSNLDFAAKAAEMGFGGIEYVNGFFKDKAEDMAYLDSLNANAKAAGVEQLLIMIDGEGDLGDQDEEKRKEAIENHKKWVRAAAYLGCHSIRVNAYGEGTPEAVSASVVKSLSELSTYAVDHNINVIVENHGSYSSDGIWLSDVMDRVGLDNCGTLPDFGNFCIEREDGERWGRKCVKEYDRYKGVTELMRHAKAVSAKSHDFDEEGNEINTDYERMMKIVVDAGYNGYVGVEYEGENLGEEEGVAATRDLLIKVRDKLAAGE